MPTFDEARHVYIDDGGKEYPGITSRLRKAGLLPERPPDPEALERGRRVHAAIAFDIEGDLDETSVAPDELPYVVAARLARRELELKIEGAEIIFVNVGYGYATAIDAIGTWGLKTRPFCANWKTGPSEFPHYRIQTALEAMCFAQLRDRLCINLLDDGTYRLHEHKDRRDFDVARAALAIAAWKEANHE